MLLCPLVYRFRTGFPGRLRGNSAAVPVTHPESPAAKPYYYTYRLGMRQRSARMFAWTGATRFSGGSPVDAQAGVSGETNLTQRRGGAENGGRKQRSAAKEAEKQKHVPFFDPFPTCIFFSSSAPPRLGVQFSFCISQRWKGLSGARKKCRTLRLR